MNIGLFTRYQIAVIKNNLEKKRFVIIPYLERTSNVKLFKEHRNKINKIKETGSAEQKKGSGRKTTTSENEELVEELICYQEEHPALSAG